MQKLRAKAYEVTRKKAEQTKCGYDRTHKRTACLYWHAAMRISNL
jgi:hypothetical protein